MIKIRKIIRTNCKYLWQCRWLTVTYEKPDGVPMTDTEKLLDDVESLIAKIRRQCKKFDYGRPEYINVCEPQHDGSWHCHIILIFPNKAPLIPCTEDSFRVLGIERKKGQRTLSEMWNNGFCSIKSMKAEFGDVDDLGNYLTAYLTDMTVDDANKVKNLDVMKFDPKYGRWYDDETGKWIDKATLKGARLQLYPANFHILRPSRGIKKPIEKEMTYKKAKEKVSGLTLTYSSTKLIQVCSGNDVTFRNVVSKKQFNAKRKSSQAVINGKKVNYAIINGDLVDTDTGEILEQNFGNFSHREKKYEQQSLFEEEG